VCENSLLGKDALNRNCPIRKREKDTETDSIAEPGPITGVRIEKMGGRRKKKEYGKRHHRKAQPKRFPNYSGRGSLRGGSKWVRK